jgi:hypothetical protein
MSEEQKASEQSPGGQSDSPVVQRPGLRDVFVLPFSRWWPVLAGVLFGILLRLMFSGQPGSSSSAMSGTFIFLAPFLIGAVTVYVAESSARRTWGFYLWSGMLATMFAVLGTLLIMIEGLICVIVIAPLFGLLGAIGGILMGAICRYTDWPKPTIYGFSVLPFVLAAILPSGSGPISIGEIEKTMRINAPAEAVWQQLIDAREIQGHEVAHAWIYRIGVPLPIAGIAEQSGEQLVRQVTMGKAIHFKQIASEWRENRFVRWTYRFSPDSFPPNALDDHVRIGGHYFDLISTDYVIVPVDDKTVALKFRMSYRVSTQFNWYANKVAQLLIGNFGEVILDFYRHRAEAAKST